METSVDFGRIKSAALARAEALVQTWLPGGRVRGQEYVVRNPTRGDDHPGSFSINLESGAWSDFATNDRGGDLIDLYGYIHGLPNGDAARRLAVELGLAGGNGSRPRPRAKPKDAGLFVVAPIPQGTPKAPPHPLGKPSKVWTYRDSEGRPMFYVVRWDTASGKEIRPLTLWKSKDGAVSWQWKHYPAPRPPYGLDQLAARPDAPVMICEGEKAADAGAVLFPDHVVVTSPGGGKAAKYTAWSPLAGRAVVLAPDLDEPGLSYAAEVACLARAAGAASIHLLDWPVNLIIKDGAVCERDGELVKGFDLGDAQAEGWTAALTGEYARIVDFQPDDSREPRQNEYAAGLPTGFRLTGKGLAARKSRSNPKKVEPKSRPAAKFPGLVDLVEDRGQVKFLVVTEKGLELCESQVDQDGEILIPPSREAVPYPLADGTRVLEGQTPAPTLYEQVVEKLKKTSVLERVEQYHLAAAYVFFTYLHDKAAYLPYLWLFGLPERGKSRLLKVLTTLSFRGLYSETLRESYIFRFADLFGGTLGLDLYEVSEKAQKNGSQDLLLGRFEQGMKVARVVAPEKGPFRDTVYYAVSGPTIIATNVEISPKDPLLSRCLKITLPEARGIYPNITPTELAELRGGLLRFRAIHMNRPLPDAAKPIPGRLGDLLQPLLAVARLLPNAAEKNLHALVSTFENERRDAEADSLPGRIACALQELQDQVRCGQLPLKTVLDHLNQGLEERYRISDRKLGRELAAMAVHRKKSGGTMQILWEDQAMRALFSRFAPGENSPFSPNSLTVDTQGFPGRELEKVFLPNLPEHEQAEGVKGETQKGSPRREPASLLDEGVKGVKGDFPGPHEESLQPDLWDGADEVEL